MPAGGVVTGLGAGVGVVLTGGVEVGGGVVAPTGVDGVELESVALGAADAVSVDVGPGAVAAAAALGAVGAWG